MQTIKIAVEVSDIDSPIFRNQMSFSLEQIQDLIEPVEALGNLVIGLIDDTLSKAHDSS